MSGIMQLPTFQKRLASYSTTLAYTPCSEWIPAAFAVQSLRAVLRSDTERGQVLYQLAVQTAAIDPSDPSGWTTVGTIVSAPGSSVQDITLTSLVGTVQWVRFGVAYRTNTTGYGEATLFVSLAFTQRGSLVGRTTQHLVSTSTDVKYLPLTGWIPTQVVNRVLVSQRSTGVVNAAQWSAAYQLAESVVDVPDAWTSVGTYWTLGPAKDSGEVTPVVGTASWIRFGIAYKSAVGTTFAQADTQLLVSTRRA